MSSLLHKLMGRTLVARSLVLSKFELEAYTTQKELHKYINLSIDPHSLNFCKFTNRNAICFAHESIVINTETMEAKILIIRNCGITHFNTQLVKSVARFYILLHHSTTLVRTGIAILQLHNIAARQGATFVILQHKHLFT